MYILPTCVSYFQCALVCDIVHRKNLKITLTNFNAICLRINHKVKKNIFKPLHVLRLTKATAVTLQLKSQGSSQPSYNPHCIHQKRLPRTSTSLKLDITIIAQTLVSGISCACNVIVLSEGTSHCCQIMNYVYKKSRVDRYMTGFFLETEFIAKIY